MPQRFDLLNFNFKALTNPDFVVRLFTIAEAIELHPDYKDHSFPKEVPNSGKFRDLGNRVTAAITAAQYKDSQKEAELKAIREDGEIAVGIFAHWAVIRCMAEKRPVLVTNLGYEQKNHNTSRNTTPSIPLPPDKISVKHGPVKGVILVSTNRVTGTGDTEVQMCQGDPTNENNWTTVGHYKLCRNMEVKGLTPGQVYHFRVRCQASTGYSSWSSIVTLMCL